MTQEKFGAISVSVLVVLLFGMALAVWAFIPIRPENKEMLLILVGMLSQSFGAVVMYWVGSSAGSKSKDELLLKASPPKDGA